MSLPHPERHRWVKVISSINRKINEGAGAPAKHSPQPSVRMTAGGGVEIQSGLDIDAIVKRQLEKEEQSLKELAEKEGSPPG